MPFFVFFWVKLIRNKTKITRKQGTINCHRFKHFGNVDSCRVVLEVGHTTYLQEADRAIKSTYFWAYISIVLVHLHVSQVIWRQIYFLTSPCLLISVLKLKLSFSSRLVPERSVECGEFAGGFQPHEEPRKRIQKLLTSFRVPTPTWNGCEKKNK